MSGAQGSGGRAAQGPGGGLRDLRLERLLPLACLIAAGVLFASEFMTTFEFTPPGGEALAEQSSSDRHSYAQAVLAVFAVAALVVALANGSKPAATAVAACGVVALLIFLLLDLPDANNVGTFDDPRESFFDAEAVPQSGFWLQLIGALGLAISGAALATLTSEQIASLAPGRERDAHAPRRPKPPTPGRTPEERGIIDQAEGFGDEAHGANDANPSGSPSSKRGTKPYQR
jgi:hypothetical protein